MSRPSLVPFFICLLLYIGSLLNVTTRYEANFRQTLYPLFTPFIYSKNFLYNVAYDLKHLSSYKDQINTLETNLQRQRVINKFFSDKIQDQEVLAKLGPKSWTTVPVKLISIDNIATLTASDLTNIKPGQPVISDDTIVGLVQVVEAPIIKVLPLTHLDMRLNVQTDTNVQGQYLFKNSLPLVTNIPSEASFNAQATIFTLPSEMIPENLIVGSIEQIITNPAAPSQEVSLKLERTLTANKNLFIIIKP